MNVVLETIHLFRKLYRDICNLLR